MVALDIGAYQSSPGDIGAYQADAGATGATATGAAVGLLATASATCAQSIPATATAVGLLATASAAAVQVINATGAAVGLLATASAETSQSVGTTASATGLLGVAVSSATVRITSSAQAAGLLGVAAATAVQTQNQGAAVGLLGTASGAAAQPAIPIERVPKPWLPVIPRGSPSPRLSRFWQQCLDRILLEALPSSVANVFGVWLHLFAVRVHTCGDLDGVKEDVECEGRDQKQRDRTLPHVFLGWGIQASVAPCKQVRRHAAGHQKGREKGRAEVLAFHW